METLTFFLHGTGQHEKGRVKSIISALSEACSSPGYILSGPAGVSAEKTGPSYMPGTYKVDPQTGGKTPIKTIVPTKITEMVATATGWGVEQNLIEMLIHLEHQQPPPEKINLLGYSRGADACLRFANVMYEFYPDIDINIFAIDPVPGLGRQSVEQSRQIPPNVKHYVSTLALNENKTTFNVQDYSLLKPVDYEKTKIECLPFPGEHAVQRSYADDRPGTREASELIQDAAIDQLEAWGTTFGSDPKYPVKLNKQGRVTISEVRTDTDPIGLIFKYSTMISDIDRYGKLSSVRSVARHREDYVPILSHCFINQHHMKVFAKTFPVTYKYMLDPTDDRKENSMTELRDHPRVQEWLDKTFEAKPEKKQNIFFDINKDPVDKNYLRVTIAAHQFLKNPLNSKKERKMAEALIQDCKNILKRPYSDKEGEIESRVERFCQENKASRLTRLLTTQFTAKAPSITERVLHDLKAANNQTLFQRLVESIDIALSKKKEQHYSLTQDILSEAIKTIDSDKTMSPEKITATLKIAKEQIKHSRTKHDISKPSRVEKSLEKLQKRSESKVTLQRKAESKAPSHRRFN